MAEQKLVGRSVLTCWILISKLRSFLDRRERGFYAARQRLLRI